MKASLSKRFLCAVLIAGAGTVAHAANERPRDTGVVCARAANAYCKVQDPATRAIPHDASPDARATD